MSKNLYKHKSRFLLIILLMVFSATIFAQTEQTKSTAELKVTKQTLDSKLMQREMPYNLILPLNYDDKASSQTKYPVIYLLHGLFGHYNNWAENTKLKEYAAQHNFIIVMPEGNNGWYVDSKIEPNDKYESYIVKELIPEIDKKYRTIAGRNARAVAGLSMGGYGSLKFAVKYPEMFSLAGSFSGALGAADYTDKNTLAAISKSVMTAFGEAESETRKNNDLFALYKNLSAENIKNLPFIYVDCGTEDFLIQTNRQFLSVLQEKKIPHEYRELPGVHDWRFWNSQIEEFLELSAKFFVPKAKAVGKD